METIRLRKNLLSLANNFLHTPQAKNGLLVNVIGVDGMGKSSFLQEAMPALLKERHLPYKIFVIHGHDDVIETANKVATWLSNARLTKIKKANRYNQQDIEEYFEGFASETAKQETRFALLIDDFDNLPVDDLDWFQAVVIDSIKHSPRSIIIVTSHNELWWHSWEMRNLCKRVRLPRFSLKEIKEICRSTLLSKRIYQLSSGHPGTVAALIDIAKNELQDLSAIRKSDIVEFNSVFLKELKRQIDKSVSARTKFAWLQKMFWLSAAAEGFDCDLLADIAKEFGTKYPDEIADLAWEMAYTGLAGWDFERGEYQLAPELRGRIITYMKEKQIRKLTRLYATISDIYLMRAQIVPDSNKQLKRSKEYLAMASAINEAD